MLKIFGAGMAGLLTANILRQRKPVVHELQASLPDNHGALLRFRSDVVSRATGIEFRSVVVTKGVLWNEEVHDRVTLPMANAYSRKVTGSVVARSIMNLEPGERWIAPDDFVERLSSTVDIEFNSPLTEIQQGISTIPMPELMKISGWNNYPSFQASPIYSNRYRIHDPNVDVYQTVYFPEEYSSLFQHPGPYRASITGNLLTVEFIDVKEHYHCEPVSILESVFGIDNAELEQLPTSFQAFGKLLPIDEVTRRSFILAMTREHSLYSVGRFATWRQLLLDDIVSDINSLERFMRDATRYQENLEHGRETDGSQANQNRTGN